MEIKTTLKYFNSAITFDDTQFVSDLKSPEVCIAALVNQAVREALKTLHTEGVIRRISPARVEAIIDEIVTIAASNIENDLENVIDDVISTVKGNAEDPKAK
jgi:hypothetical protein